MFIQYFQNRISDLNPMDQTIFFGSISLKWQNLINQFPLVAETIHSLRRDRNDNIIISRQDVFETIDLPTRIIKSLIWGYPKGMQGTANLKSIVEHLDQIVQMINDYNAGPFTRHRFVETFRILSEIRGLGPSTLSKILYFCGIHVGQNRAVIVDTNVLEAFGFLQDFHDASYESDSAERYYRQIVSINSSARRLNVTPDQIEYFLFELGKQGKRVKTDFVTNY